MTSTQRVYLVDDDEAIRKSTSFMLQTAGFTVMTFASGRTFLAAVDELEPGCIVLDLGMPEMDGLQVQAALRQRNANWPAIVITGQGEVGQALHAMKAGASGFFEKPFERAMFVEAIEEAFLRLEVSGHAQRRREEAQTRLLLLSADELHVLRCLLDDIPAKAIALHLGLSQRAAEIHRASLMQKLDAVNLSQMLRIAFMAGLDES
jgi:two-component system response regulator FixJ